MRSIENAYIWKRFPEWRRLKMVPYRISVEEKTNRSIADRINVDDRRKNIDEKEHQRKHSSEGDGRGLKLRLYNILE